MTNQATPPPKTYDDQNIFAKILRGEIPNNTAFENEYVLAFHDITPQAPLHILIIPKGAYIDIHDFSSHASPTEIAAFYQALSDLVEKHNLDKTGFRTISNAGVHGGQEVPHFHLHLLGGAQLGAIIAL